MSSRDARPDDERPQGAQDRGGGAPVAGATVTGKRAPRRHGIRPTQAQQEQRFAIIFGAVTAGSTRGTILRLVAEAWRKERDGLAAARAAGKTVAPEIWGPEPLSERTVDYYIARAHERFMTLAAYDRETEIGKALARYALLFERAITAGQFAVARDVQKRIDRLLGLEQPMRTSVAVGNEGGAPFRHEDVTPAKLTQEQRAVRAAQLFAIAAARRGDGPVIVVPAPAAMLGSGSATPSPSTTGHASSDPTAMPAGGEAQRSNGNGGSRHANGNGPSHGNAGGNGNGHVELGDFDFGDER